MSGGAAIEVASPASIVPTYDQQRSIDTVLRGRAVFIVLYPPVAGARITLAQAVALAMAFDVHPLSRDLIARTSALGEEPRLPLSPGVAWQAVQKSDIARAVGEFMTFAGQGNVAMLTLAVEQARPHVVEVVRRAGGVVGMLDIARGIIVRRAAEAALAPAEGGENPSNSGDDGKRAEDTGGRPENAEGRPGDKLVGVGASSLGMPAAAAGTAAGNVVRCGCPTVGKHEGEALHELTITAD